MSAVSVTESRSLFKSAHFVLVLTVGVALTGTGSPALGIVAYSTDAADVKMTTEDKLPLFATSPLAVFTKVGDRLNQFPQLDGKPDPNPAKMMLTVKRPAGDLKLDGIGETVSKFENRMGVSHNFASTTAEAGNPPVPAIADAVSDFTSTRTVVGGNVVQEAKLRSVAAVAAPKINVDASAAAETKDPVGILFDTPGVLQLEFYLGTSLIDLDPFGNGTLPSLALRSEFPGGEVHFDASIDLFGVTYAGMNLDGELFRLVIEGSGIVDSIDDLIVRFIPWSGLSLSSTVIKNVEDYVIGQLGVLPDGAIGLGPGERFALFGPGSPLQALTFQHGANLVVLDERVAALATVSEPGGFVLLGTGMGAMIFVIGRPARRRSSSGAGGISRV